MKKSIHGLAALVLALAVGCEFNAIELELLRDNQNGNVNANGNGNANTNGNVNANTNGNVNVTPNPACAVTLCGAGETCSLNRDGDFLCSCGSLEVQGASACDASATCASDRCNHPPVATISDDRPEIRVLADVTGLRLTAERSYDLDLDRLGFAWTTDGACTIESGALEVEVYLATGNEDCVVTLTVDDGLESVSTRVTLTPSTTGTHVRASSECVSGPVDANATRDQGTPGAPWCTVAEGVEAARQTGYWEVRLATDPGLAVGTVTGVLLDEGILLSGGWNAASANGWSRGATRTPLAVSPGVPLRVSDGTLERVRLEFPDVCLGECPLLTSTGGIVRVVDSEFQPPGGSTDRFDALRAIAIDDSVSLFLDDVTLTTVGSNVESTAVFVDGRDLGAWVKISNSSITLPAPATRVVGIRTINAHGVTVEGTSIVTTGGDTIDDAYGVLDGQFSTPADECPDGASVCGGASFNLSVFEVRTDVRGQNAYGVVANGSSALEVRGEPSSGSIAAQASVLAVGLHTVDTVGARISGQQLSAVAGDDGIAAAWLDGVLGDPDLGSDDAHAHDARFSAGLEAGSDSVRIHGVFLSGSRASRLERLELQTDTTGAGDAPLIAVGLRTWGVDDVALEDSTIDSAGPTPAADVGGAVLDGQFDGGTILGTISERSRDLRLEGNVLVSRSAHRDGAGECVLLIGTQDSWLRDNRIECVSEETSGSLVMVRVLDSEGLNIADNRFSSDAVTVPRYIGVLDGAGEFDDGSVLPFGATAASEVASSALAIERNRFEAVDLPTAALFSAIVLSDGNDSSRVLSNAIKLSGETGFGVELDRPREVDIRHNTILAGASLVEGAALRVKRDIDVTPEVLFASNVIFAEQPLFIPFVFETDAPPDPVSTVLGIFSEGRDTLVDIADAAALVVVEGSTPAEVDFGARQSFLDELAAAGLAELVFFGNARICSGDFIPASSSNAIDAGSDAYAPGRDIDGRDRVGAPDVGAAERPEGHVDSCIF